MVHLNVELLTFALRASFPVSVVWLSACNKADTSGMFSLNFDEFVEVHIE